MNCIAFSRKWLGLVAFWICFSSGFSANIVDETLDDLVAYSGQDSRAEVAFCDSVLQKVLRSPDYTTLVSVPRLRATIYLSKVALSIHGDFVETGVYQGGTSSIMMRMLMANNTEKLFYAFDSFQGLPETVIKDGDGSLGIRGSMGDMSASQELFESNLKKWGTYNSSIIRIAKGYFNESLPKSPVQHIAFLRADGDLFISTHDTLRHLYHRIVPGGFIYIDDYGSFVGCRRAVDAFRDMHHIFEPMHFIREDNVVGRINFEAVWWRKRL